MGSEAVGFSPTPSATPYLPPDDQQTAGWQTAADGKRILFCVTQHAVILLIELHLGLES